MLRRSLVVLLLVLIALLPQMGLSQVQLGQLSFPKAKALPLDNPTQLPEGLPSYSFLSNVGGVAFGGVALNRTGHKVVALSYDARKPDGQRLRVVLESAGGRKVGAVAAIHDWQLVPIARFAATDQSACFTMFGNLADPVEQAQRRAQGHHILGYHPAFQDTLLGLRLFQADILIIRPDACDLPTVGGRYLLGAGEQPRNVLANQTCFDYLHGTIERAGSAFTSYVICDYDQEILFSVNRSKLSLTGSPYWYCWRRKIDDPVVLQELQNRANDQANTALNAEINKDRVDLSAFEFNEKWTTAFQRERHGVVFDQVMSANLLQPMPELSAAISSQMPKLDGINPVVYQALLTTMRYAAFFRHFKQQDAPSYEQFVASLADVAIKPPVETPAVMVDADSNVRTLRAR